MTDEPNEAPITADAFNEFCGWCGKRTCECVELTPERPKIFVLMNGGWPEWLNCLALAEDGTALGGHVSSSTGFGRIDMGLVDGHDWTDKRAKYAAHYPDGYDLVDLLDLSPSEQLEHPALKAAIDCANERHQSASAATSRAEGDRK